MNEAPKLFYSSSTLIFSERQRAVQWVYILLGVSALLPLFAELQALHEPRVSRGAVLILLYGMPFVVLIMFAGVFNFLCMRTSLDEFTLTVAFGDFIPFYSHKVPLSQIGSAVAITYNPLLEFRGWGIRSNIRGESCFSMQGREGVQLVLKNGQKILIGSGRAEELADRIRFAKA